MYVCYVYFNKDQSISQSINDNAQLFTAKRRSTENGTGSCSYENVNNTLADDIGSLSLSLSVSVSKIGQLWAISTFLCVRLSLTVDNHSPCLCLSLMA